MICNIPYTAKLSRGKTFTVVHKNTIHWKTFAVHQAHAIMYCTQQMIQGENFRNWLKNRESFAVYGMAYHKINFTRSTFYMEFHAFFEKCTTFAPLCHPYDTPTPKTEMVLLVMYSR